MKRFVITSIVLLLGILTYAQRQGGPADQAPARGGRGGPSPEQQARIAKQAEAEQAAPKLQFTEDTLPPRP